MLFNWLTSLKRSLFWLLLIAGKYSLGWFISELNCEKNIKIDSELENYFKYAHAPFLWPTVYTQNKPTSNYSIETDKFNQWALQNTQFKILL